MPIHRLPLLTAALLVPMALPLAATPSEGTAGQTVTGRSAARLDSPVRTAPATPSRPSKPAWAELSAAQRQALSPLAPHWDRLSEERKRKWLAISRNYPNLSSAEQAKLHRHMSEWATLSQHQRIQARQNFTEIRKLSPEQKTAEWEAYQALSPEEKRKFSAKAPSKPVLASGKSFVAPTLTTAPRRPAGSSARQADLSPPFLPLGMVVPQESPRQEPERSLYDEAHTD
ncbi:MAG: DUF3106 domain-containing protein [Curvibacter sp.]|jgi:hypothetical protein